MVRRDTRAAKARVGILAAKAPTAPQVERLTCYSMIYLSKKKKKKMQSLQPLSLSRSRYLVLTTCLSSS